MALDGNLYSFFEHKSDKELWKAFKEGQAGAFAYLYDLYFDILFNYGSQFSFSAEAIEDFLQDFFIELNRSKHLLGDIERIKPYLLKSFRRLIFRKLKQNKKIFYTEDAIDKSAFRIGFHTELNFPNNQFTKIQREYLDNALTEITKRQREAVYYFYFEDLSYAEVADVMGLNSAKGARNLIYQALATLRKNPDKLPKWLLILLIVSGL